MALLDRLGKQTGLRAVDLLGGAARELIPVDYWCGRKTPDDLRETVARASAQGFRGIKMKSRKGDPVGEQVSAIREAGGPGFAVTVDPMYQWFSPHDALHLLRELEEFGGGIRVEDPFPEEMPEYWRRARQVCSVPLIWHARGMASLRRGLQEKCCDGFNACGGVREFLTAAHAIEVEGYSCWRGSSLELGVAQAAGLHAAAAARACVWASDFQGALIREHTLVTWDWPYREGSLPLPEGAGLGVELDREAISLFRTAELAVD
jgi:muconate cycloisomerase